MNRYQDEEEHLGHREQHERSWGRVNEQAWFRKPGTFVFILVNRDKLPENELPEETSRDQGVFWPYRRLPFAFTTWALGTQAIYYTMS